MYPFVRLAKVLGTAPLRRRLGPFEDSLVAFRVWPGDLDTNGHLNNGRYLALMDLGRWDLTSRTGLLRHVARRRWAAVAAAATIRFRRGLTPFQPYVLRTRLLGWDDRSFFLQQSFERGGVAHAVAAVRVVFLHKGERVAPQEAMDLVQPGVRPRPLPAWVRLWDEAMEALGRETRTGAGAAPEGDGAGGAAATALASHE